MKERLSIRQVFSDSLSFMANNALLLGCLTILSFIGSLASLYLGIAASPLRLLGYGIYIYLFYYLFVSLYYEQQPLISKEKFIDSLLKMICIFALSLLILICGKLAVNILHHMSRGLMVFPEFYSALRSLYVFLTVNAYGKIVVFLGVITLLTFSFFIPMFAWISSINGRDCSILSAYIKVRGNYLKTIAVFVILYGILPLIISLIGVKSGHGVLAFLYALQTVFQITVYLHLYDKLYHN